MPTYTIKTKYAIAAPDVRGRDKGVDSESGCQVNMYITAAGKDYLVGKFKLSVIRALLGSSTEYYRIADTCAAADLDDGEHNITTADIPSDVFSSWAENFDESQTLSIFQLINK